MNTRENFNELFYTIISAIMPGLNDNPRPIDEILRIHLMTETIMEKLIEFGLGDNAEAVLSAKLTYAQKLSICSKLKLDDQSLLLTTDVSGSLKKLNKLRNKVAHNLEHETTDQDVEELFVGQLGANRTSSALNGNVWDKLSSYKAGIYLQMFQQNNA
jgi:hypothetical protein